MAGIGVTRLEQLAKHAEADVLALHGMGPNAMAALREAMKREGLAFRKG